MRTPSAVLEPPATVSRPRRHIAALDGLRGIAVLGVMLYHFAMAPAPKSLLNDLLVRVSRFGWVGVDVFFVLSGFLVSGILIDARQSPRYFRNFYARRTLRIFPLYYGVLAAFYLIGPHLAWYDPPGVGQAVRHQAWYWLYASNFLVALKGQWVFEQFNHFWSLPVEEHYYLFWPAIVYLVKPRRLAWVCVGVIGGALALRVGFEMAGKNMYWSHLLSPSRADSLALGGLIAVLARNPSGLSALARPARWVGGACVGAILLIYVFIHDYQPAHLVVRTIGFTIQGLLAGALLVLVVGANPAGRAGRILGGRVLGIFSKYSYGLYIFHVFIGPPLRQWLPPARLAPYVGAFPALVIHILASLAVSLALALLSWHLFEKHVLKLKRLFR